MVAVHLDKWFAMDMRNRSTATCTHVLKFSFTASSTRQRNLTAGTRSSVNNIFDPHPKFCCPHRPQGYRFRYYYTSLYLPDIPGIPQQVDIRGNTIVRFRIMESNTPHHHIALLADPNSALTSPSPQRGQFRYI